MNASESPRSGLKHKAWGVSPRKGFNKKFQPAKRAAGLSPVSRAQFSFLKKTWGLRPRLYAFARCAGLQSRSNCELFRQFQFRSAG
jgi:hypothetical protein